MSVQSTRSCCTKTDPLKNCKHCGAPLIRKRINGRMEDRGVFIKRKCCNRSCMANAMAKPVVGRRGHQCRARKHRGSRCEQCGGTENLSINHKNRDWSDDRPENLETLCISCHMKKHWAEPGGLFPKKNIPCIICGRVTKLVHGMCGKHWQRFKRYGDANFVDNGGGLKNAGPAAINAAKTCCVHGHELSGDNLIVRNGKRQCRACNKERARRSYRKKHEKEV